MWSSYPIYRKVRIRINTVRNWARNQMPTSSLNPTFQMNIKPMALILTKKNQTQPHQQMLTKI